VLHKQFSEEEMYKKMTDSIYTPSEEEIHWLKALSEIEIL